MIIIDQHSDIYHIVTYDLIAWNHNIILICRASSYVSLKIEVHRHARNMLTNLRSIINMIGGGPMQSLNAHENRHSTNHEANDYGHALDMLMILH